ncbi:hypothetical protein [Streptomyces sp. NPDC101150]|uniref:hypothetical protein n=1 Tax=Streptomyces sp. NPDC101150 TaxID=3366114 RepID=UPI0037F2C68A
MAAWEDVVAYIKQTYRTISEGVDEIQIDVDVKDGETQIVIVTREVVGEEEWASAKAPCFLAKGVDLAQVLKQLEETTAVGGAVIASDYVTLRHTLPLRNLDVNELGEPLELVASAAIELVQQLTG